MSAEEQEANEYGPRAAKDLIEAILAVPAPRIGYGTWVCGFCTGNNHHLCSCFPRGQHHVNDDCCECPVCSGDARKVAARQIDAVLSAICWPLDGGDLYDMWTQIKEIAK